MVRAAAARKSDNAADTGRANVASARRVGAGAARWRARTTHTLAAGARGGFSERQRDPSAQRTRTKVKAKTRRADGARPRTAAALAAANPHGVELSGKGKRGPIFTRVCALASHVALGAHFRAGILPPVFRAVASSRAFSVRCAARAAMKRHPRALRTHGCALGEARTGN
jgi:hypothetical protein